MPLFVLRRLLSFVLTLLVTSVVVFAVLELLPGNAAQVILGETATPESIAAMEEKLGLNQPAATRYLSWMGGMLFAGMVVAILAGLVAVFFEIPALGLAMSAMVALLSAGFILYETSNIVNGGETNYVMATVSLFVSMFNLFTSLLSLFGIGGSND